MESHSQSPKMNQPPYRRALVEIVPPGSFCVKYAALLYGVAEVTGSAPHNLAGIICAGLAGAAAHYLERVVASVEYGNLNPGGTGPEGQLEASLMEIKTMGERGPLVPSEPMKKRRRPPSPNHPFVLANYVRDRREALGLTVKKLCERLADKKRGTTPLGRAKRYNEAWITHLENDHFERPIGNGQIDPLLEALETTREVYDGFAQQFIRQQSLDPHLP